MNLLAEDFGRRAREKLAELERDRLGITLAEEAVALGGSLRAFVPAAWHIVEPMTPYVPNWHIDAICDHLEALGRLEIRRLLINIPPRHMKSLTVSVMWPAWLWTTRPHLKFLTGSYGSNLAHRDTVKSRDIIGSKWYGERWPSVRLKADVNRVDRYENMSTGVRIATSVGGPHATGEGGDVLILDDPHKADEVTSDTFRAKVINWHDGTFAHRWNDQKTGVSVIVMQRLHEQDLAGHVLEKGNWTHLCLPARYERKHPFVWPDDPRTEEGELLWPVHVPEKELEDIATTMMAFRAAGQLQQRPAAQEGERIKRAWWKFFDIDWLNDDREGDLPRFTHIVCSWDTSLKDKKHNDFVSGQAWGIYRADRYLLRTFHRRINFQGTIDGMREMHAWVSAKWPRAAVRTLIEMAATGPEAADTVQREFTGVTRIKAQGSKEQRVEAAAPAIESHNCFVPGTEMPDLDGGYKAADWVQSLIEECAVFPNGMNDDQVDALSQALNWARSHSRPASVSVPQGWAEEPGELANLRSW